MRYIVHLLRLLLLQLRTKERNGKARTKGENHDLKIQDLANNKIGPVLTLALANDKIALTLVLVLPLAHAHPLTVQNATSAEREDISNVIAESI
jgi:hypothetical protein